VLSSVVGTSMSEGSVERSHFTPPRP
jgi:hypothetical protein